MEQKKILFIDDNNDFLTLSEEELESNDYQIDTILVTKDSDDILDRIKAAAPDLIFLDVMFSNKFSNALASDIRKESVLQNVPIYLISFLDIGEIMAIANKNEVNGCFVKPVKREDVAMLFEKHFGLHISAEEDE